MRRVSVVRHWREVRHCATYLASNLAMMMVHGDDVEMMVHYCVLLLKKNFRSFMWKNNFRSSMCPSSSCSSWPFLQPSTIFLARYVGGRFFLAITMSSKQKVDANGNVPTILDRQHVQKKQSPWKALFISIAQRAMPACIDCTDWLLHMRSLVMNESLFPIQ